MSADGFSARPIARGTMTQHVAAEMRRLIAESLSPGDRLPSERDLGQRFGIGRTTVREAMRVLESEGVVVVRPGRGTFVNSDGNGASRRWHRDLEAAIEDLLVVRLLLEPAAAALAADCRRSRSSGIAKLRRALAMMDRSVPGGTLEQRVAADVEFHRAIAELAGNRLLEQLLDNLNHLLTESRRVSLAAADRVPGVHRAHSEIAQRIVARDAEGAASAMTQHLLGFAVDMGLGDVRVLAVDAADFERAGDLLSRWRPAVT